MLLKNSYEGDLETYGQLAVTSQILHTSAEWKKHASTTRDFEAVLEYAKAISSAITDTLTKTDQIAFGEQIFVKLVAHCMTLRRLSPDPTRRNHSELWDLSSMSAVARCAIEAHDAFVYIALGNVTLEESSFRINLWLLHDNSRRLKMLDGIGSERPEKIEIRQAIKNLQQTITESAFYQSLGSKIEKDLISNDPPPYYLSQRERCDASGVNYDHYNTITMKLSQFVHTLPFAIHQLFSFKAGNTHELLLMSLPLRYVMPFLSRVTEEMRQLFPGIAPNPPSRTARTMAIWLDIYANEVKVPYQPHL